MHRSDAADRRYVRAGMVATVLATALAIAGWSRAEPADIVAYGATLAPVGAPAGLIVTSLENDGAAARAGLRVGDVVDRVDDDPAPTPTTLLHASSDPVALIHVAARGDGYARTLILRHAEVGYREDPDRRGR